MNLPFPTTRIDDGWLSEDLIRVINFVYCAILGRVYILMTRYHDDT